MRRFGFDAERPQPRSAATRRPRRRPHSTRIERVRPSSRRPGRPVQPSPSVGLRAGEPASDCTVPPRCGTGADRPRAARRRRCRRSPARTSALASAARMPGTSARAPRVRLGRASTPVGNLGPVAVATDGARRGGGGSRARKIRGRLFEESAATPRSAARPPARRSFRARRPPTGRSNDSRIGPRPR